MPRHFLDVLGCPIRPLDIYVHRRLPIHPLDIYVHHRFPILPMIISLLFQSTQLKH
jgi:hypothetical protein